MRPKALSLSAVSTRGGDVVVWPLWEGSPEQGSCAVHGADAVRSMRVEHRTTDQESPEPSELPAQADVSLPDDSHASRGTSMTWGEGVWEFTVNTVSWFIAFGALVFVLGYVAFDAIQTRRKRRP